MITRVKIAPMNKWCEGVKADIPTKFRLDYRGEVAIITESMGHWGKCDGRRWRIEQESMNALREQGGFRPINEHRFICEHMLELD